MDLPTATEPATPTTNGVVESGSPRNALVSAPSRFVVSAYSDSSRDSGRYTSATSAMSSRSPSPRICTTSVSVSGCAMPAARRDHSARSISRYSERTGVTACGGRVIGGHPAHRIGWRDDGCRGPRHPSYPRRHTAGRPDTPRRYSRPVRLGVLDIGSNTVHLLVADVRPGGRPLATTSQRTVLRLMRYLGARRRRSPKRASRARARGGRGAQVAAAERVDELLATATSAVREAANGPEVIARIEAALGQPLQVLGGETEARFTFLAVRRWFGWAAGQILLFDIGGGSLEIAAGADELPEAAASVPLGAGRMTIAFLPDDPPGEAAVERLRAHARDDARPGRRVVRPTRPSRSRRRLVEGDPLAREARRLPGAWLVGDRADAAPPRLARLVDSAAGAHPGIRSPGAAGDHAPIARSRSWPAPSCCTRRCARSTSTSSRSRRGRCAKACCCATSSRSAGAHPAPEPPPRPSPAARLTTSRSTGFGPDPLRHGPPSASITVWMARSDRFARPISASGSS